MEGLQRATMKRDQELDEMLSALLFMKLVRINGSVSLIWMVCLEGLVKLLSAAQNRLEP